MKRLRVGIGVMLLAALALWVRAQDALTFGGRVTNAAGEPLAGVFVSASRDGGQVITTLVTDADGAYQFNDLPAGAYTARAHYPGYETARVTRIEGDSIDFTLQPAFDVREQLSGAALMALLPEGEETREFILDCAGCHSLAYVYDRNRGFPNVEEWEGHIGRMLATYGPSSGFPIIGARDAGDTAAWLATHLPEAPAADQFSIPAPITGAAANVVITEFFFPGNGPHDLVVLEDGGVMVTGMFDNHLWRLDPARGDFAQIDLNSSANPRALVVGEDGAIWLALGQPQAIARYDPATETYEQWRVGFYPHSIALDPQGRAWVNGHFTDSPVEIAMFDPADESITRYEIPTEFVQGGLPISYDLIATPDGMIWTTELVGNRLCSFDPATGESECFTMPETFSGPRRIDYDAEGNLWIPEFAGQHLTRFDPITETFTRYPLPTAYGDPYVVKVDRQRGYVYVAYATADAVVRFDPSSETFTEYRLPTPFALIRHMGIDDATGDVWVSYHHVPTLREYQYVARLDFVD